MLIDHEDLLTQGRRLALRIISSEKYLEMLRLRADAGTLSPQVETLLWHMSYGKPADKIEVKKDEDLSDLSTTELITLAKKIQTLLEGDAAVNERMSEATDDAQLTH